jgi:hypothetical protein
MFRKLLIVGSMFSAMALAQGPGNPNANVNSTEVLPDHHVVFRIYAPNADKFAYAGVFSMGIMAGSSAGAGSVLSSDSGSVADFEKDYAAFLADPEKTNKLMKVFWIGSGKDNTVVGNSPKLLDQTLTVHKIRHEYHETEGGHSYANWRPYLRDFTQLLFR